MTDRFEFDDARFGVYLHGNFRAAVVLLFIGGRKRVLERFDERLLTDPLFFHQIGKRRKKLLV